MRVKAEILKTEAQPPTTTAEGLVVDVHPVRGSHKWFGCMLFAQGSCNSTHGVQSKHSMPTCPAAYWAAWADAFKVLCRREPVSRCKLVMLLFLRSKQSRMDAICSNRRGDSSGAGKETYLTPGLRVYTKRKAMRQKVEKA